MAHTDLNLLGFSHLREHKFRHNFVNTKNPLCSRALGTKSTEHFFFYAAKLCITSHRPFNCEIVSLRPTALLEVILYVEKKLNDK